MILQEGKYYRARSGVIYGPLVGVNGLHNQPFGCSITKEAWCKGGSYYIDGTLSNYDLLSEVKALEASPPVINQGAPPKVDRVEIASRILPRLAHNLAPTSAAKQALQYADAFIKEIGND